MLFERQRLLLTFLDTIGEPVGHTDFQKLLFLYTRECETAPTYEFVPYKFGGFSFTSYADKRKLIAEGLLEEDDQNWKLTDAGRTAARKQAVEPLRVAGFCRRHFGLRGNELIIEQYRRHPYYATRSEILEKLRLEPEALARIAAARPKRQPAALSKVKQKYLDAFLKTDPALLSRHDEAVSRLFSESLGNHRYAAPPASASRGATGDVLNRAPRLH